jgi:hypothetical protein
MPTPADEPDVDRVHADQAQRSLAEAADQGESDEQCDQATDQPHVGTGQAEGDGDQDDRPAGTVAVDGPADEGQGEGSGQRSHGVGGGHAERPSPRSAMIESRKTDTPTVWPGMVMAIPKLAATSTTQL